MTGVKGLTLYSVQSSSNSIGSSPWRRRGRRIEWGGRSSRRHSIEERNANCYGLLVVYAPGCSYLLITKLFDLHCFARRLLSLTVFINTAKERGHFKRILEEDMTFCLKVWAENLVCLWSNIRYFLHITLKLHGRSHYPGSDSFLVCGVWSIIIALSSETSCSLVQSMPSTIHKHSDIRSQDYFKLMLFILAVPDTHTRVAGDGGSMSETVSSFSFHWANNLLCWCVHTCHAFLPRTRKNSNTHTRKSDLHVKVKKKKISSSG